MSKYYRISLKNANGYVICKKLNGYSNFDLKADAYKEIITGKKIYVLLYKLENESKYRLQGEILDEMPLEQVNNWLSTLNKDSLECYVKKILLAEKYALNEQKKLRQEVKIVKKKLRKIKQKQ